MANEALCAACGSANEPGRKFCGECGIALATACPSCGTPNGPGVKFCGECGSPLTGLTSPATQAQPAQPAAPAAERRLVSVLFADLVGFTTLSERRDAEETRELLSRYFETSRRLIELYGGTVEKFIGDAVMAVWGTPVATEDDAERAVRAALDLVAAVSALGDEVGAPELAARAGVLTGEAAVTLGAEGQGMVAGDLVNTAARIQTAAAPGAVFVGEATKRASEQAIVYEDEGRHELKGKEEPAQLFRALRVASGRRGALKSTGLEPPFVGRDRELRLVKELFHASADEKRAHLVSAMGIAGIGKSRLAWEFYKYFDGLVDNVYWHRGRCLAYGEGVTYWALADMVRMRCRISEDDDETTARSKLDATLSEHLLEADERAFVEPKLSHLIGLTDGHVSHERHDLFAAWRLFFERLANTYPTVLVFEDMQWADSSLLDFVEYLLEWSRSSPLFVLTLARPELLEKRPNWGAGSRNFTSLHLDALPPAAMGELLDGFVPGLPDVLREQILARAEGVPLYAVETVRMLLDRGLLVEEGAVYRPTGEIPSLEVPETLHGLVASRLDGLPADERRLLQNGAVLGKTFTRQALAAVSAATEPDLDPLLSSLVRKEILGVQADPTSPEHGQYGFLQDLLRHVAYETLSRKERRLRHLAAAAYLEESFASEEEIAEVLASHYVSAYEAAPEVPDAPDVKAKARATLLSAADRAAALGAATEAQRYLQQAADLADDDSERAGLLLRAGWLAGRYAGDIDLAERLTAEALALYEATGDARAAARASGQLARFEWQQGHRTEAIGRAERAFEVVAAGEPDSVQAELAEQLATGYAYMADLDRAAERIDYALGIAEELVLLDVLTRGFIIKSQIAVGRGRQEESAAFLEHGLTLALEHEMWEQASRIYFHLSDRSFHRDRYEKALGYLAQALAITRRRGSRPGEWAVLAESTYPLYMLGRWDEAVATFAQLPEDKLLTGTTLSLLDSVLQIALARGHGDEARRILELFGALETSPDVQDRSSYLGAAAAIARAEGHLEDATALALEAIEISRAGFGVGSQGVKQGMVQGLEALLGLGNRARAEELLDEIETLKPGVRPPYLEAQANRFRARLAGADETAEERFAEAARLFRELGIPFWLAVTLLEHGELTGEQALVAEAREIFGHLRATPWLERLERVEGRSAEVPA
ncbi:MAG TPA: adenylate/guanylate cyclase domain-containing protein [Gaiellaceae bacterium]|nr:adenylate/guanylate cyclase domain-containing protein [Gaiellaceae bacterium]